MSGKKAPLRRSQPLPARVPNRETVEALRQSRDGEGLEEHATLEDLKAALD